jgi:broad specificity phosphatase PhoE/predicted kinase
MVGLPARGKSYTARKLVRYLRWQGIKARVFNVGAYRRERLGSGQPAQFFDPDNERGVNARRDMAMAALDDVILWLNGTGQVAIYDATNGTGSRRDRVLRRCVEAGYPVVFIELVCNDPALVEANILASKVSSPDYSTADPDQAVADFRARIANYERAYQPMGEAEIDRSWVKVVDVGRQVTANRITGMLARNLAFYLMNLHIRPRPIWLTRHGESQFNVTGRIGGDSGLSARGTDYAERLSAFLTQHIDGTPEVYTSTLVRTRTTANQLPWSHVPLKALDEIDAGVCDGWTYAEVARRLPDEFKARNTDKLRYRYPRGESYQDVIRRLNPVIVDIERSRRPVVVVAHQAVLRALYAYLVGESQEACPHLDLPLHTAIELVPHAYGVTEKRHLLGPT